MGSKAFQFKKFSVSQESATHKVGTDGVLLGAWVNIRKGDNFVLDVGTGSGLIALMLAQRAKPDARIDAVEIEADDVKQARENVARSPWPEKVSIHHSPIQQFSSETKYNLISSNPPYFANSQTPPDKKRSRARHAYQLSFPDLLESTTRLLTKTGRLAVILPYSEGLHFINLARGFKLFPIRKTLFRSRATKPVKRLLLELDFQGSPHSESEIILHAHGERWSEEYKSLTRDFYLNI